MHTCMYRCIHIYMYRLYACKYVLCRQICMNVYVCHMNVCMCVARYTQVYACMFPCKYVHM